MWWNLSQQLTEVKTWDLSTDWHWHSEQRQFRYLWRLSKETPISMWDHVGKWLRRPVSRSWVRVFGFSGKRRPDDWNIEIPISNFLVHPNGRPWYVLHTSSAICEMLPISTCDVGLQRYVLSPLRHDVEMTCGLRFSLRRLPQSRWPLQHRQDLGLEKADSHGFNHCRNTQSTERTFIVVQDCTSFNLRFTIFIVLTRKKPTRFHHHLFLQITFCHQRFQCTWN